MTASKYTTPPVDPDARSAAERRQTSLTKPPGSLGRLEDLAVQMAAFQATAAPEARPCSVLLFACDHPVTKHGVSPYPSSVTRAMINNFVSGGAAASVLTKLHRLPLHVVDVGVDGASSNAFPHSAITLHRMQPQVAAGDIALEPALTPDDFASCQAFGARLVEEYCGEDRVVILGEMGIGNTTPAAALGAALLQLRDPATLVGPGTGAVGDILERKKAIVVQAVRRLAGSLSPDELLRQLGGREMVAMYGAMKAALAMRKIVLVDGFIVTVVALALCRQDPAAREGMVFAHQSHEQGHHALLEAMGAAPLLRLSMRLGEASGALTAFPILEAACATHNQMATFESASVPDKEG